MTDSALPHAFAMECSGSCSPRKVNEYKNATTIYPKYLYIYTYSLCGVLPIPCCLRRQHDSDAQRETAVRWIPKNRKKTENSSETKMLWF